MRDSTMRCHSPGCARVGRDVCDASHMAQNVCEGCGQDGDCHRLGCAGCGRGDCFRPDCAPRGLLGLYCEPCRTGRIDHGTPLIEKCSMRDYFHGCPQCPPDKGPDDIYNAGRAHRAACHTHRTTWMLGSNLFSYWKDESEGYQRERY